MFLFELDNSTEIRTRLVAITAQLRSHIKKESKHKDWQPWSKDDLQDYLARHGLIIDDSDLYNMVKKAPLKNIIDNMNDDEVTFKDLGKSGDETQKTKDNKKDVVAKMANKAQDLPTTGPATNSLPDLPPPPPPKQPQ